MRTLEEAPENGEPVEELRRALRNGLGYDASGLVPPSQSSSPSRLRSASRDASSLLSSPVLLPSVGRSRSGNSDSVDDGSSSGDVPALSHLTLSLISPPVGYPGDSSRSRATSPNAANEDTLRGRNNKRFTLAGVSTAIFEAISDRVRSVSHRAGDITPPRDRTRDRTRERRDRSREGRHSPDPRHRGTLSRVGEVLGLEEEAGKEAGDGWKEFKPGVYTYPISFTIPSTSPPTLGCDFGSVVWRLKAHAHRPGILTTKLSAGQEVTVVAAPDEDDTEDTENVIIERQWDNQMQYLLTISGRSFPIGGTIPIVLTFVPWTKMKIYRLHVFLEEHIDYLTQFKRVARTDTVSRIPLMTMNPGRDDVLLPLSSDDAEAFLRSPLHALLGPGDDPSDMASGFMGPGPWTIQQEIQLPESCASLHFTNKNKKSNMIVTHMLKVVFRVQRDREVDADGKESKDPKKKLYDIVVQTPIHILSCLCGPNYTSLPPYTIASSSHVMKPTTGAQCRCPPVAYPRRPSQGSFSVGPSSTRRPFGRQTSGADIPEDNTTPPGTQPSSPFTAHDSAMIRNNLFERLMTGQETESGEAPPAYETLVSVSSLSSSSVASTP
ncbi:hypothetical protein EUX98_g1120 [Antrodiella citrinella]|uniref:Arrestin C-terminal-like domain-containing protein n=1 Tax=Antrodiella citrinella TaxID=2447956 RepID=A0A4S4N285_9APHY|nr:hypothetical protein EUX98_g1120 [Antrodiella citrinella]